MPTIAALAPTSSHGGRQPFQHPVGVVAEHFLVFVQQRLALGGVDQDRVGLGGELDVGGEAGPPAPTTPASATCSTVIVAIATSMGQSGNDPVYLRPAGEANGHLCADWAG